MLVPERFHPALNSDPFRHFLARKWATTRAVRLLTIQRKDGGEIQAELSVGEAALGGEHIIIGVLRDLTERFATEDLLSDLRSELARLSRTSAMGEMAAGLAHELNQPLSATTNFLAAAERLLEDGVGRARVADLLRMAKDQTLRSGEIIRRLRDFVATQDVDMCAEPLADIVRDALALVFSVNGQFGIRVRQSLASDAAMVFGDRTQIQQLLVKLLRNAVASVRKSRADAREIAITARGVGDLVEICVKDTGSGVPEMILDQLSAPSTSTTDVGGMGLGLSICRRIAEAHGGAISAENLPGDGAIFRFTLPRVGGYGEETTNDA